MKMIRRNAREFLAYIRALRAADEAPVQDTAAARFLETLPPGTFAQVKERLQVGRSYFTGETYLRQQNRADWQQVQPDIQRFAARLIETWRKQSIPLYVHGAFRTKDEQMRLYREKRSKAIWPRAAHCQGAAVDIVHSVHHWGLTDQEWQMMGKVGKDLADRMGIPIVWGGDWSFYDPAHWELQGWKDNVRHTEAGDPVRRTARGLLGKV